MYRLTSRRTRGMPETSSIRFPSKSRASEDDRRLDQPLDLFGTMLPVGVENNDPVESRIQPMAQPGLDRFTFAAIFRMNDHLAASFPGPGRGLIGRSIIDHQNIIKLLPGPPNNVPDVLLFVVSRNDRRDTCARAGRLHV